VKMGDAWSCVRTVCNNRLGISGDELQVLLQVLLVHSNVMYR
jgi:hypothetical protein